MNIAQKQALLNILESIKEIDLLESIRTQYPTETDLRTINFDKYSASELISLVDRSILQFTTELQSVVGHVLPIQINLNNEYGVLNLQNSLNNLGTYLKNGNFSNAENELDKLILYQLLLGFWEKESQQVKDQYLSDEYLNSMALAKSSIDSLIESSAQLKEEYSLAIQELSNFTELKKNELNEIKELLTKASNDQNSINSLLNESETIKTSINGIYEDQKKKLDDIVFQLDINKENFIKTKKEFDNLGSILDEKIKSADENLKNAGESWYFMKGQEFEIKRLTGYAADGSLGSKFDERKKELDKSLGSWLKAIIATTTLAIGWIIVVFVYFRIVTGNPYLDLFINLLKTTPCFILLSFVFKHYNRERTIQEEYAFKSSVAMTLTAYSEMLQNGDLENNKSRQIMLSKAIQEVYKQPKIHNEKDSKVFSFNTKHLSETVKNLTDVVKEIKK